MNDNILADAHHYLKASSCQILLQYSKTKTMIGFHAPQPINSAHLNFERISNLFKDLLKGAEFKRRKTKRTESLELD